MVCRTGNLAIGQGNQEFWKGPDRRFSPAIIPLVTLMGRGACSACVCVLQSDKFLNQSSNLGGHDPLLWR